MKGIATGSLIAIILSSITLVALLGLYVWQVSVVPAPPVAVEYTGEFKSVGLNETELEAPFFSNFQIIPVEWASDGDQSSAGNATLKVENGTAITAPVTYKAEIYFDIDDDVEWWSLEYDVDTTNDVFDPDSIRLTSATIYDYDTGEEVYEITIKDGEFDWKSPGVVREGEYVLVLKYELFATATPSATEGTEDIIGTMDGRIKTDEDDAQEKFTDFLIRTLTI
ncbi:MAG: hypothetical protein ACE5J9_03600 [Methanosarcinales archaeon]